MALTPDQMITLIRYGVNTSLERVDGPFPAAKFEFVYESDNFPLRWNKVVYRMITKEKEEIYTDSKGVTVIPYLQDAYSFFGTYKNAIGNLSRELYLKPYKLELNKKQKESSSVTRAFARQTNIKDGCIFEINPKSSGQKLSFYKTVSIEWKLNGSKDEILLRNTEELKTADGIINGISDLLDPLELYKEELTPKQLVEKKLERLLHNPHSYPTKEEASSVAKILGLSGVLQMSDGSWMPGSSRVEYRKAMKRGKIKTSMGITISTKNIVGSRKY